MQTPPLDAQGNPIQGDQGNEAQPADSQPSASSGQPSDQPAEAQPGGPSGEVPAKTDLGVGRISLIHGNVSTQRGDSGDWSAATLNQPVMGGDKVSTGDGARTEVELDFANILRLAPNSKANLATFTHKDIQVQLGQGMTTYSVTKNSEAEPEIDTPNVNVHPAHKDGVFRIEVRPDGDTIVIVRKGEAQISTPQGSTDVREGEMATIRGDANSAQYKISQAPDPDDWDRWNADRDHMIRNAQSWHHTNHYYTGTQDLDANGNWQNVPDYGDVWVPNEPAGWAPYRDGSWTYEPYYGWTWVGYEPWGWAPYHYGRWFWYGNSWAWWPGPAWGWYRPFWAPAYVSFWGWGAGFGFGFGWGGWGGFGWLPIGPGDWFHPWWGGYGGRFGWVGHGWGYDRFGGFAPLHAGTRFSNVANIHDAHIGGALSTVRAGAFGAGGRVSAMAASREQIGGARMMAGNLPVTPTHASLSASGRAAAADTMRGGGSQHFFGSVHNNADHPASFAQQTSRLQQTMAQNHVNGFTAGSRGAEFARGAESARGTSSGTSGTMAKPSAGANREAGGFGNRGASSSSASAENANRESANRGERSFTPPNSNNTRSSEAERGNSASGNSSRDGFRSFTPPSNSQASRGESGSSYGSGERGGSSYWNRTAPSSSSSGASSGTAERSGGSYSDGYGRGSSSGSSAESRGSYSRPQLDMRQPIVRSPYGGYSRGGYGESRPSYSRPSYGGSRPSYGGGSRSAPSYGGSHSGGGHVSAPHSSGGGHSSGGHSGGGGHGGHR
jgi:hypothetical protein